MKAEAKENSRATLRHVFIISSVVCAISGGFCLPAAAASLGVAGSDVQNTAQVALQVNGVAQAVSSNTVLTRFNQVLDVANVAMPPALLSLAAGATDQPLAFKITNRGNGEEAFDLTVDVSLGAGDFTAAFKRIVVDTDGDGVLTAADTVYQGGATRPVLAPGQSVIVWVVCDIPAAATGSAGVRLTASVVTGHGTPGLVFAGQGDGGVDAVVGTTGASAWAQAVYQVGGQNAQLIKSQTVVDLGGGARAMPGSVITYTLDARFLESGSYAGAQLADAIPAGTSYVAGSVQLDGVALADAAAVSPTGVSVALGNLRGPAEHTLTFQVRINQIGSSS